MRGPGRRLPDEVRTLLSESRRAVLTTIDAQDGRPRSVPICFVVIADVVFSPLDDKPKSTADPHRLHRVRNLAADPRATILADRWDEDWHRLAFAELQCRGGLLEPDQREHPGVVAELRAKYPQYLGHRLETRPILRFDVLGVVSWRGARN